jgi:hypothetical protein
MDKYDFLPFCLPFHQGMGSPDDEVRGFFGVYIPVVSIKSLVVAGNSKAILISPPFRYVTRGWENGLRIKFELSPNV